MKKIFICCTYYHLLISIIKSLKSNGKCDVLLSTGWNDFTLIQDKVLIEKLKKSNIFSDVILDENLIDKRQNVVNSKFKELKKYFLLKKIKKNFSVDLSNYDEVYIFSYNNPIGRIINKNKIYHNLLEDGTDCYKNNRIIIKSKISLKSFIKKHLLKLEDLGESKYTKSIEVNDLNGVVLKNKKIIEASKKKMFESLTNKEKKLIVSLFMKNDNWKKLNNTTLIITQPFYMDNILKTEDEQIKIYKDIVNKYCNSENIIIKPHPRDYINYESIISKSNIINDIFPIEILNFTNVKFNKVITISSTAINLIYNCNEKIFLGWKWLQEKVREYERRK